MPTIIHRGTLIITTDDVEWSYQVNGRYPDFNIQNMSIASKVDSGNSKSVVLPQDRSQKQASHHSRK